MPCFAWVNTVLSNLKTAIRVTYHAFKSQKYAHRYSGEARYRFAAVQGASLIHETMVAQYPAK